MLLVGPRGELVSVTNEVQRERRMVRRLRAWWRALDGHVPRRRGEPGAYMVTLTYRPGVEWRPRDITEFLRKARGWGRPRVRAYAWVAELQSRGAVHYHVVLVGERPTRVADWWGKGFVKVSEAWSVGYLLKYLWKSSGQGLPRGCHRFGVWVEAGMLCKAAAWVLALSLLPAWVAEVCEVWGGLAVREGRCWIFEGGLIIENAWRVF